MINIRHAKSLDASDISGLSNQLGYPTNPKDTLDSLSPLLSSENHVVIVAELSDGTIVGWIHVFKAQRIESGVFAEIGGFIVSEKFQGKGIGRKLLQETEKWAKHKKLTKVRVRSKIEREDATKFYTNMNFSQTKQQNVFDKSIIRQKSGRRVMKVIQHTKYGSPDILELKEVENPVPRDNEVLVKVHSASVNYNNLLFVKGEPLVGRFFTGLFRPKFKTPGNDIAGIVEATGKDVKKIKRGDEVFGDTSECGFGAFAEYVAVPENALGLKPVNLSFAEAAAVPEAGLVALQAFRDKADIKAGQTVLICGVSGGIGTFAVQIASHFGAKVTGVCGTKNIELVKSLGAEHVIDYSQEKFPQNGVLSVLILATAGHRSIFDYRRSLKPQGRYIVTGGSMSQVFQGMLIGPLLSMVGKKKLDSFVVTPNKDLNFLTELIEAGKIKPVIDKQYLLNQVPDALKYYDKGHARGKVVITIE